MTTNKLQRHKPKLPAGQLKCSYGLGLWHQHVSIPPYDTLICTLAAATMCTLQLYRGILRWLTQLTWRLRNVSAVDVTCVSIIADTTPRATGWQPLQTVIPVHLTKKELNTCDWHHMTQCCANYPFPWSLIAIKLCCFCAKTFARVLVTCIKYPDNISYILAQNFCPFSFVFVLALSVTPHLMTTIATRVIN